MSLVQSADDKSKITVRVRVYGAAECAENHRSREVQAAAQKWAPENWKETYELWYAERKIDFVKLIQEAKQER